MKFLQHEDFRKYPVIAENMPKLLQINFVTKLFGATLYLEHSWEKIKGEVRHIFIFVEFLPNCMVRDKLPRAHIW